MAEAEFHHGSPRMEDYTAGADVVAGDVVVIGDRPYVAHRALSNGDFGALAAGGGVYKMVADAAIAAGMQVYWNAAAGKVTETAGANKIFGYIAAGSSSGADGDSIFVAHEPLGV